MAGKKSIFDLYNEQNPKREEAHNEKIVEREPETEKEKVVPKEEPKEKPKEEPKTETTPELKTDAGQAKESEGGENV